MKREKTAGQIFSGACWQIGPMTFNALYLDRMLECFQMGINLGIPGKGPLGEHGVRGCSLPLSAPVHLSQLFREAGKGCFQFASWNPGRAWSVFHYRICTPIKANFYRSSSASKPRPIPTTSPSFLIPSEGRIASWVRFAYLPPTLS